MLCVSGGINPDVNLFTQSIGLIKWDDNLFTFKPDKALFYADSMYSLASSERSQEHYQMRYG